MTPFEFAYEKIAELVQQFKANEQHYLEAAYQEAEVRADFLDKFWIALGWDVSHSRQTNPREQEVKVERNPDATSSGRKADYAFYLAPDYRSPIFFCEAKKPSRKLGDPSFYFQLVRYGHGAGTPMSVLTDFEEFHIVDCRYKADEKKSYPSAQIKAYRYTDYLDRDKFGEIYWLFSYEAVATGKYKDEAKRLPKQRGKGAAKLTAEEAKPADEALLTTLEEYRLTLAKAFKKADESMDAEALTEATQKVIDRLVFVRFLEDKGIELDYIVDQIAARGPGSGSRGSGGAWKSFVDWSKELDVKYNGVVFKPHEIDKPGFKAPDDKVFATVCADISHSRSKYLFSYIPIELLGSIYERFLGKVVTATAKRADIEYKPEVRKAGGVYYTPKYIVDYIVANTVGKILDPNRVAQASSPVTLSEEPTVTPNVSPAGVTGGTPVPRGLSPKEVSKLRFADIACGSGSFLIAVYDAVLHHVESWYNAHPDEAKKAGCVEIDKGIFALSLKQKQKILLDNVYGVDIDPQAVEVAQLSLFLKLLESESGATTGQMSFEKTKILPDLSKNIVCGNSLVDYDIEQLFPLTQEEKQRINPLSFESHFREIMRDGGFDAIVGNPPYVFGRDWKALGIGEEQKRYFTGRYIASRYQLDMFSLFMERCFQLCKTNGRVGEIVPNVWLSNTYSAPTRAFFLSRVSELELALPPKTVFKGIVVDTVVYDYRKSVGDDSTIQLKAVDETGINVIAHIERLPYADGSKPISLRANNSVTTLLQKICDNKRTVGDFADITRGVHSYRLGGYGQSAFKSGPQTSKDVEARPYHSPSRLDGYRPFIYGKDLRRFACPAPHDFVLYGPQLAEPRDPRFFLDERIYSRKILGERLVVTVVNDDSVADQQVYITKARDSSTSVTAMAAILGSRLMSFFIKQFYDESEDAFPQIKVSQLRSLPLVDVASGASEIAALASLVGQEVDVNLRLYTATRDSEREQLQRKCEYLDERIDRLVYELYGLTEDEIKIVEGR
jgi:adenine-specific DNA-methyltransferase